MPILDDLMTYSYRRNLFHVLLLCLQVVCHGFYFFNGDWVLLIQVLLNVDNLMVLATVATFDHLRLGHDIPLFFDPHQV